MASSSVLTWVLSASMIAEAFGASADGQSGVVAAIAPVFLIAMAGCIIAVAAFSIHTLRQRSMMSRPSNEDKTSSTTVDIGALSPPSLTLNLDDDNILDLEDEEDDEEEDEESKTRRIVNLAQVMKSARYFRQSNGMDEFPYSPSCRRTASSSSLESTSR
ncbi:uncharacterized protein [Diadema setosum]|uniref:uncharacterized protein n=1 Tax=Diadema setosum TaxID=31175 RepID=UPI003B3ADCD2